MKKRLEYKYLVPEVQLDRLRKDMVKYLTTDPFALRLPEKEYLVRSIYLDTSGYKSYYDKTEGLETRNKFRIRGYNIETDKTVVFLEIKKKEIDFISKSRARLYYCDLNAFLRTSDVANYIQSEDKVEKDSAAKFLFHYYLHGLVPSFLVVYHREAYQCKFGSDLRITLDKKIKSTPVNSLNQLFNENYFKQSWPGFFVLEIKFNMVLPVWLPGILKKYDLKRISASKYAKCFDVHRGIKRYNRIHSVRFLTNS